MAISCIWILPIKIAVRFYCINRESLSAVTTKFLIAYFFILLKMKDTYQSYFLPLENTHPGSISVIKRMLYQQVLKHTNGNQPDLPELLEGGPHLPQ